MNRTRSQFKELFSAQSGDYARFRPTYPDSLFAYLASLVDERATAWDCGTGSGQAALKLADRFARVIATDPNGKQLENAAKHPRVEYRMGPAESSGLPDYSIDLVTAAQAFHWFRQDKFFNEVRRVLRPRGILAVWCYGLAEITPDIDAVVYRLYKGILGDYWEKERRLVEEGYKNARLPFQEIAPPSFEMTAEWGLDHWVGYLRTWSALQTYIKKNGTNPLDLVYGDLTAAWGLAQTRPVRWNLALRLGRADG